MKSTVEAPIQLRLYPKITAAVEAWRAQQPIDDASERTIGQAEAIRRLLIIALRLEGLYK